MPLQDNSAKMAQTLETMVCVYLGRNFGSHNLENITWVPPRLAGGCVCVAIPGRLAAFFQRESGGFQILQTIFLPMILLVMNRDNALAIGPSA